MEKSCEFCKAIRPVVYCKADAAHLCLSCDAKIHSANTVFNRHQRTVLCESCQARPTYVQCLDHRMFMCNACDRSQHTSSSSQHHRKRSVRSYTGCPPAKDFAALWDFQSSEIDNKTLSTSCGSCGSSVVNYDIDGQSCSQIECFSGGAQVTNEMGSSSKHYKIYYEGKEREETSFILHQILDLERLQLAEGNSPSAQSDLSSSAHHTSKNFDENLDWNSQPCEATGTNFQLKESPLQNLKDDPLPFPFSQQEQLPSESTMGLPLQTESIWPCRSPVQSSQLWSQNMQDLGICEELVHHDDFNIPDVDVTFRNFEELFGNDQDPTKLLVDDKDVSYSSMERDMSLHKSDDRNSRAMVDTSEDSSMSLTQPADFDKDTIACNKVENVYHSHPIRPSSTLSFTPHPMTRISTLGDDADCHDTRPLSTSLDVDARQLEVRATSRMRYKEKKHSRLTEKKLPYPSRKATANVHNRGKGRIVKRE